MVVDARVQQLVCGLGSGFIETCGAKMAADSFPVRLRSGCGMTKQKEQATSKKKGQKQIPFGDDRQERQQQSKKNKQQSKKGNGKENTNGFRLNLRYQISGCGCGLRF
jgi:hypothetical protein